MAVHSSSADSVAPLDTHLFTTPPSVPIAQHHPQPISSSDPLFKGKALFPLQHYPKEARRAQQYAIRRG